MDDKELFESATTDEAPVAETPEIPAEQTQEQPSGQLRDDHGRFAAKPQPEEVKSEPETVAQAPEQQPERIPEFRREFVRSLVKEALDANNAQWSRQFEQLQSRLPKPEQPARPDMFENPDGFVDHGVRQQVDPLRSEIGQLREFYSKKEAIREHGAEKVKAAYGAIEQGLASRDPEVVAVYQRAMQSMDPFGDIVSWHQQKTVYSQIGSDPNAWFEKHLGERMKDPAFQSKLLQSIQQAPQSPGQQRPNIVQLPPSLNRVAAAGSATDAPASMNDVDLYRDAIGR